MNTYLESEDQYEDHLRTGPSGSQTQKLQRTRCIATENSFLESKTSESAADLSCDILFRLHQTL